MALFRPPGDPKSVRELFPVNSRVIHLGHPYYGSIGEVLGANDDKVLVNLSPKIPLKFKREKYLATLCRDVYLPAQLAARREKLNYLTFSKITGAVNLYDRFGETYNIGLNLKSEERNEELVGYTKRDGSSWLYTEKAIELVKAYKNEFPDLFCYLDSSNEVKHYLEHIYPVNGHQRVEQIANWLKKQNYTRAPCVECGSEFLPPDVVADVEMDFKNLEILEWKHVIEISPKSIYPVSSDIDNIPPIAPNHFLLDRVVTCRDSFAVPVGVFGLIIGIHKGRDPYDTNYLNVLFETPIEGVFSLQGSSRNRAFVFSENYIINISEGIRNYWKDCEIYNQNFPTSIATLLTNDTPRIRRNIVERFLELNRQLEKREAMLTTNLTIDVDDLTQQKRKRAPEKQQEAKIAVLKDITNTGQQNPPIKTTFVDIMNKRVKKDEYGVILQRYYRQNGVGLRQYRTEILENNFYLTFIYLPDYTPCYGLPRHSVEAAQDSATLQACITLGLVEKESRKATEKAFHHSFRPAPSRLGLNWVDDGQLSGLEPGPFWR